MGNSKPGVWAALAAALPEDAIQERKGAHGRMLDYIDRPVVWERLDAVVPGEWDFTIIEVLRESGNPEEPFAVRGRLQILGCIREDIGLGKDMKDASTDAFKRCAVQFGIGRQLYVKGKGAPVVGAAGSDARAHTPISSAPEPSGFVPDAEEPSCPKCGGKMWDNRLSKKNPKAPDYKCRSRSCDGVVWPPKAGAVASAPLTQRSVEEILDMEQVETDDLPF